MDETKIIAAILTVALNLRTKKTGEAGQTGSTQSQIIEEYQGMLGDLRSRPERQ